MNGILLVNKEKDYTSRDVVNIVSKVLKTKKVGHTGTLDPLATGVLVITVGNATKASELITATYKEYIADIVFGIETDTLDVTGNILKEEKSIIEENKILEILKEMTTTYNQEVPKYSAVKVNGKKLYEYARNGEDVDLPKKEVTIKELELLDYSVNENKTYCKVRCLVSKGTYIRSLIRDIAYKLGAIGTMKDLVRTRQGKYSIENCYSIEDVKNNNFKLLDIEDELEFYTVNIDSDLEFKVENGQLIENIYNHDIVMFKGKNIISIYKKYEKNVKLLKPWKVFKKNML